MENSNNFSVDISTEKSIGLRLSNLLVPVQHTTVKEDWLKLLPDTL